MAKVGDSAHTDHGLGTITEVETIRGRSSFRVAGKGFNVWVPETRLRLSSGNYQAGLETTIDQGEVNDRNTTTLPYDPSPQYPVDLFRKEQTILPGDYEIDPEDRLHPSESLTKKRRDPNRPYPGPNPDLFAKGAARYAFDTDAEGDEEDVCSVHHHGAQDDDFGGGDNFKEWGEDQWHEGLPDGPERTFGKDATYRPAGLSDRYAYVPDDVDERDPITAFRADPLGFMQRRAYAMTAGEEEYLGQKFADYDNLLEASQKMRTAAWTDVRQKAQRLRHEGKVQINHVTPQHIYATVNGDNGVYDTMIVKGASGAFSGGQSIANWYCDCDWGKWAFKRKYSYVGRLCSHAYAAYLDMQSQYHQDNGGKFKSASVVDDFKSWAKENNDGHMDRGSMTDFINTCEKRVTKEEASELYDYLLKNTQVVPERDYDTDYTLDNEEAYKTAADTDALRQRPLSLTPDLRMVPEGEDNQWVDVTEDERKTTGPEQIVHFSALASKLHTADQEGLDAANGGGGPQADPLAKLPSLGDVGGEGSAWNQLTHGIGDWFNDHPGVMTPGGEYNPTAPAAKPPAPGAPAGAVQPAPAAPPAGNPGTPSNPTGTGPLKPDTGNKWWGKDLNSSQPSWFPKQESTTTNTDPNSPWTQNKNNTQLKGNDYTVQRGDTLADIAQRSGLGGNYQDLAKSNNISDPNMITPGQQIKLPGAGAPGGGDKGMAPAAPAPPPPPAGGAGQANNPNNPLRALQVPSPAQPPAAPKPPAPVGTGLNDKGVQGLKSMTSRLHFVADNDDDDERPDTGEAASKLNRLRELSEQDPSDHYQHMDDYNDEVRQLVEELNDAGVDAMPFVANRFAAPQGQRKDNDPSDGDANFAGQSNPNWADEPFNGSGPDPQLWMSDSASYVDENERPDFTDVTDLPDGDIIKFNDSRSKPEQGPRHGNFARMLHGDLDGGATIGDFSNINGFGSGAATDPMVNGTQQVGEGTVANRHYADDGSGYFNPNNPSAGDWEEGSGSPFMDEVNHAVDQSNPLHGGGGAGGGTEGAEGEEGVGALAEEAPELLALAHRQSTPGGGFSLEAFDRGEFALDDSGAGLRRANRVGGGPAQAVRVDHGARGWKKEAETYNPPEDFGNNGDPEMAAYGEPSADPTGGDVLANFQRSAGALEMVYGQGSNNVRAGSLDDFGSSPMVQKMLRTAGRVYSPAEMAELEGESHVLGARNMPTEEDLAGTHYLM